MIKKLFLVMLIKTFGCAVFGISATKVTVEVNITEGINFFMVGLPDNAIKESHKRIDAALKNNGYRIPGKSITVNMAPADLKKEGSAYDLTIAVGILAAANNIPADLLSKLIIMGELSLDGELRPIRGALPISIKAKEDGFKGIILPEANAEEASVVDDIEIYPAKNLKEVINFLNEVEKIEPYQKPCAILDDKAIPYANYDFSEVKGQENCKRALEIAAGGGHNVILIGPPGAGKTMISKRLPSILPPLSREEALETTKIHSVAGKLGKNFGLIRQRPFRAPHHTISDVALVGGGVNPQPGEISLAHNGVLFLDELPEFKRTVLEVMRQPLEDRFVNIARAKFSVEYPASFMLVASMNPCPCGYFNHPEKECVCGSGVVQKYLSKISGPLLDRIDLHVEVTPVSFVELSNKRKTESSEVVRNRVIEARKIQKQRFENSSWLHCNAQMESKEIQQHCKLNAMGESLLKTAMEKLGLSARAYDRILKVARTIADLDESSNIETNHIAEAIQFRSLDRNTWVG